MNKPGSAFLDISLWHFSTMLVQSSAGQLVTYMHFVLVQLKDSTYADISGYLDEAAANDKIETNLETSNIAFKTGNAVACTYDTANSAFGNLNVSQEARILKHMLHGLQD